MISTTMEISQNRLCQNDEDHKTKQLRWIYWC